MYFITCLENLEKDALGWLGDARCFGYFQSYERARAALETNECDVWEMGIFEYAVIEKVEPGIHPHGLNLTPKNAVFARYPNPKKQMASITTLLGERRRK